MMAAHLGRIGFVCIFGVLACDGLANNPTDTLSAHGKPALAPHASSDDHSTHEAEPPLLGGTALGHGGHAGGNAPTTTHSGGADAEQASGGGGGSVSTTGAGGTAAEAGTAKPSLEDATGSGGAGGMGAGGAGPESETPPPKACACIHANFQALGPKGTKGKIDGPGDDGNGSYQVLANECHAIQLKIHTGYIDVDFSLTQTPWEPCIITLSVSGSLQGQAVQASFPVQLKKEGNWLSSWMAIHPTDVAKITYWGGTKGNSMTIEINGYNHTFSH